MFNSRFIGFSALFLLLFLSLCVRPVRAAALPVVNPPTPALVTPSAWPVGQVGTSPTWAYNVNIVANGAPVTVQPQITVTSPWQPVAAPSGTSVSVPVPQTYTVPSSPSAASVPAIPSAPSASVTPVVNAGAGGAGSAASSMTKKAFGVGAGLAVGAAAVKFIPYVGTALAVGQVGFALYDALKTEGITVNPDGSASLAVSGYLWGFAPCDGVMSAAAHGACLASKVVNQNMTNIYYVVTSPSSVNVYGTAPGWGSSKLVTSVGTVAASSSSALTNDQLIAALDRVTSSITVAADAINFSMARGVPLPDGLPITNSIPTIKLTGLPDLTSSSTDSVGNTTKNFLQPTATVDLPTVTGGNPTISTGSVVTTTTNNSTTNTTNNYGPPILVPAISPAGVSGNLPKPNDLCVDHPDILACSNDANVGDVASAVLANKDINIAITPVALATAMCPAPITFMNSFGRLESWDIFGIACRQLSMYKPLIIAFAWLAAGLILFGGRVSHE